MTDMLKTPAVITNWIAVGRADDFTTDQHVCTKAGGKHIVVFYVDGEFHVISNVCPHAGLPLGEGDRRGMVITCPFHGYAYHIKTGRNLDWPEDEPPVKTYPTRVVDGVLEIQMEQPTKPASPQPQRGPAPQQKPDDEDPGCDSDPRHGDAEQPECPTGYPNRETAPPQQPSADDPKPKSTPTKEGN